MVGPSNLHQIEGWRLRGRSLLAVGRNGPRGVVVASFGDPRGAWCALARTSWRPRVGRSSPTCRARPLGIICTETLSLSPCHLGSAGTVKGFRSSHHHQRESPLSGTAPGNSRAGATVSEGQTVAGHIGAGQKSTKAKVQPADAQLNTSCNGRVAAHRPRVAGRRASAHLATRPWARARRCRRECRPRRGRRPWP